MDPCFTSSHCLLGNRVAQYTVLVLYSDDHPMRACVTALARRLRLSAAAAGIFRRWASGSANFGILRYRNRFRWYDNALPEYH